MATFKDHFSQDPAGYAAYRPTYPPALVDFLAGIAPGCHLALDCGCGTGQLSALLAGRFDRVVATDASEAQVRQAEPHPHVEYRVAPAEASGLSDGAADLVTVAQAAHWFDLPRFYAEVRRVARPGAVLALITYGVTHVDGTADTVLQRFYWDAMEPYWPPERRHVEDGYRSLPFPFAEIDAPPLAMEASWRLADLLGYVETWSGIRAAERAGKRDVIDAFRSELTEVWGDPANRRAVHWPLSLRVGRV